jgi:xanthine dehydrogenase accessory factor
MSDVLEAVAGLVDKELFGSRATCVGGPALGHSAVIHAGAVIAGEIPPEYEGDVITDAGTLLDRERSLTLVYGDHEVFIESIAPRSHLVIFGAVHIAQELCAFARRLGFHVTVSDARTAFTTTERFPEADRLLIGWPDEVEVEFDRRTFVVVLSHDARFEDPLWPRVLPTPVPYIGAMGSSRTAQRRRERLIDRGFTSAQVDRIHGPIGLRIGAETPSEVAVAILGEIIAKRHRIDEPFDLIGTVVAIAD